MALRSSVLAAADTFVRGVVTELPLTDPVGVDVVVDEPTPFCLAACLAAFSARRFCLDADWGAISVSCKAQERADGRAGYHRGVSKDVPKIDHKKLFGNCRSVPER